MRGYEKMRRDLWKLKAEQEAESAGKVFPEILQRGRNVNEWIERFENARRAGRG